MKIIRLQIPGNFLRHVGFAELFEELEFVEILNAFQYDQKHFFALQRIKFKEKVIKNLTQYIEVLFSPESFQLLERRGNEVIGILDQKRSSGFYPIIDSGPWAFLFPIHVSSSVLLINIISRTEYVNNLFNMLSKLTQNNFKIIGMTDVNDIKNSGADVWQSLIPFPKFTPKQEEIAKYAAKNGFFTSPKKISAKDLSEEFKISESAVNKHLRKATNLAMDYFFGKYFPKENNISQKKIIFPIMQEFEINRFLTLKLDHNRTEIYVNGKLFGQCKSILLKISIEDTEKFEEIESIDEAADMMGWTRKEQVENEDEDCSIDPYLPRFFNLEILAIDPKKKFKQLLKQGKSIDEAYFLMGNEEKLGIEYHIDPKTAFGRNCSKLQAWYEHNYDTQLLHSNIAFPLLKKLADVGDPLAKRVFKEEIIKRLKNGYPSVVTYIIDERYLDYLNHRDFDHLIKNKFHIILKKLSERCSSSFISSVIKTSELSKVPKKFYSDLLEFIDKLRDDQKCFNLSSIVRAIKDKNLLDEYLPEIERKFRIYSKHLNKVSKKNADYALVALIELVRMMEWKKEYFQTLLDAIYGLSEEAYLKAFENLLGFANYKKCLGDFFLTFLDIIDNLYKLRKDSLAYMALITLIREIEGTDLLNEYNPQVKAIFFIFMKNADKSLSYDKNSPYSKFIQWIKSTELEAEDAFQEWIHRVESGF